MKFDLHRREQWDLSLNGQVKPILVLHVKKENGSKRIFVLWKNGFRGFGIHITWTTYG